jgi:uncharacterized protein with von Willebrand factor type A (vWA) domain
VADSADLPAICAAFGDLLHRAGVPVTPERSARFTTSVVLAEPASLHELYWLGRVTLTTAHDQHETYDRVFRQVFRGLVDIADIAGEVTGPDDGGSPTPAPPGDAPPPDTGDPGSGQAGRQGTGATPGAIDSESDADQASALAAVSARERVNDKEFSTLTDDELRLIQRLVEQLPLVPPLRRGRRTRRHRSSGEIDIRATLRRSHRSAGDPVQVIHRKRTTKPRRIILIADVSGSMEPYARIYLHLLRGAVRAIKAEAFVFATHLTRLTRQLSTTHTDVAYRQAAAAANDWSGGTRIGVALRSFVEDFGRRGMARGAVIVIVSDGWESDRPELLAETMERLSRLAHHIIWVNPRKAAQSFEPLAGGMAAALPYVDTFLSGHSLRALQDVMDAISDAGDRVERTTRARARLAS